MLKAGAAVVLAGLALSTPSASDIQILADAASGVAIAVPLDLFPLSREASDAVIALTSGDEQADLDLRIDRATRFSRALFDQRRADLKRDGVRLSYERFGAGFFALSGLSAGGLIVYEYTSQVTGPACDGCTARLSASYPPARKGRFDAALGRIAASLRVTADIAAGAARAEDITRRNPDVARWMRRVRAAGGTPMVSAAGVTPDPAAPCAYTVQAYEDVSDSPGRSHTATFGWFDADVCSGSAVRQPPE